jgi:hypothetical protein
MEKFSRQQAPDWPAVTIRKNGSICINSKAIELFDLKGVRYVTLHFDREESLLGIRPGGEKDQSVFRVVQEKTRTYVISCQAFLKSCEIPYKAGSRIYRAGWDEKRGMILVKIT